MSKRNKEGQYWRPKRQWLPEWNLASVPEELLRSELQRRNSRKRKWHGAGPGRPRSKDRCPCGEMTAARAAKRNHRCAVLDHGVVLHVSGFDPKKVRD